MDSTAAPIVGSAASSARKLLKSEKRLLTVHSIAAIGDDTAGAGTAAESPPVAVSSPEPALLTTPSALGVFSVTAAPAVHLITYVVYS